MTISITVHDEHLPDRAAMLVMRTMITLQPAADLGLEGRPAFDDLMEKKTTPADGADYEQAVLGRVVGPPIAGTKHLRYYGSSLSSNHPRGGALHAGDPVPDRAVRYRIVDG